MIKYIYLLLFFKKLIYICKRFFLVHKILEEIKKKIFYIIFVYLNNII